jgi:predicted nucleic acid-binding protein
VIVPALVVAEAGYLIERDLGPAAEAAFVRSLATPRYEVVGVDAEDLQAAAALIQKYADLPLGVTDATVIVAARRRNDNRIATLDRRHFTIVSEVAATELLP